MIRKAMLAMASVLAILICSSTLVAQSHKLKYPLITQAVDEQNLVTLGGSTRPEVTPANDRGPVAGDLLLDHMYLQLRRTPEQEEAVKTLIDRLHDPKAPEYHHWLTAYQIAERFGPAEEDIRTITGWLESHGFTVNVVYRPNGVIDFSGPASEVKEAFHTEIHRLSVKGEAHIANVSNLQIPAALAPAILGVVSMNDFHPKSAARPRPQYTYPFQAPWSIGGAEFYALVPGDLQTIYNFNPLYAAGLTGRGQTIVVVENSDVYSPQDWYTFRDTFGLSKNFRHGSFEQTHPQPSNSPGNGGPCADPGPTYDDFEAILDAEWASASAPDAAIVVASCADTNASYGVQIALQNLVTAVTRPPAILSVSYVNSETENTSLNAYWNQAYQTAVLRGVSVFVVAGDNGAAESDFPPEITAVNGINVNAFASPPYVVAVGGTDFADTYLGQTSKYWSPNNGKYFNSALSYIPETPWNDSCASPLIANFLGFSTPYGTNGLCNSPVALPELLVLYSGGGGPSACAYGTPSIPSVVSGTCQGYPKPLYQYSVSGNPNDGVRDLPDVSLFAADGVWNHAYIICDSDVANYGAPCVGAPSNWTFGGGTSFAAPIMAGIQAMINQASGSYQGNPNYIFYALGALEYDFGGAAACNSTLGNQVNPNCIFYDVTFGDTSLDCSPQVVNGVVVGTFNCYIPSGTYGVLSLSNTSYEPAYPATPGWDFASGLGTVNAYNLVRAWPGSGLH